MSDVNVFAIGNFDGVHLGHRRVLDKTRELSSCLDSNEPHNQYGRVCNALKEGELFLNKDHVGKWGVITLDPHPSMFFNNIAKHLITPKETKMEILLKLGASEVVFLPFSDLHYLDYKEFFNKILVDELKVKGIVTGENFCFGHKKNGTINDMRVLAKENNIEYEVVEDFRLNNKVCSSSLIREYLSLGEVKIAAEYLGRNFSVKAKVVEGNKLARQLGFPTANLVIDEYANLKYGVYIVKAFIDGVPHKGIANFGVRPSVQGNGKEILEVHIFDFDKDLYGNYIGVEFIDFVRKERKFNSLDELKNQIAVDISFTREYVIS